MPSNDKRPRSNPQNSVRDAGKDAVRRGSSGSGKPARIPAPPKRGGSSSKPNSRSVGYREDDGAQKQPSSRAKKARRDSISIDGSELERSVGKKRAARLRARVEDATAAYLEERFIDAGDILRPIAQEAPDVAMVRELLGLTHYRRGQWKSAVRELTAFQELSNGSVEQHPVLADCYRALGKHNQVDELIAELGAVSPSAELMTEGRIVRAGSLADRGELAQAIEVLEKNRKTPKRAKEYHLRRAYVLADLYEQAGETPRARSIFEWIVSQDRNFADAAERL